MNPALIIQTPVGSPAQLLLLFHGVGADAGNLLPLGRRLAVDFPEAAIVSVGGSEGADFGAGRQWFSVRDISEENRPARVAAALPAFLATIRHWQAQTGVAAEATALIGFSQGAIMALEAAQSPLPVAGRVVAIAGRFARRPERPIAETTLHLIHGKADPVIAYAHTIAAAERLIALGSDATADVLPFVGHEINAEVETLIVERLQGYVPLRLWRAALQSGGGDLAAGKA